MANLVDIIRFPFGCVKLNPSSACLQGIKNMFFLRSSSSPKPRISTQKAAGFPAAESDADHAVGAFPERSSYSRHCTSRLALVEPSLPL
jgi:hypothetical protein